mmetsp:Transcript_22573/g.76776  ORF Transcript_22573/g.76776 Transcript_22573/m.76776 type:complete len:218 (+) Transcript_22573:452-1105(+)
MKSPGWMPTAANPHSMFDSVWGDMSGASTAPCDAAASISRLGGWRPSACCQSDPTAHTTLPRLCVFIPSTVAMHLPSSRRSLGSCSMSARCDAEHRSRATLTRRTSAALMLMGLSSASARSVTRSRSSQRSHAISSRFSSRAAELSGWYDVYSLASGPSLCTSCSVSFAGATPRAASCSLRAETSLGSPWISSWDTIAIAVLTLFGAPRTRRTRSLR